MSRTPDPTRLTRHIALSGGLKLALLSSWDPDLLKAEMEVLIAEEFEIEVTGFITAEVDLMFDDQIGGDPDELQPEDITEVIVSRLGDLWQLGSHRLLCGDALAAESYTGVLGNEQAQMSISDPPYNVRSGRAQGADRCPAARSPGRRRLRPGPTGRAPQLPLHPLGLILRGGTTYLMASKEGAATSGLFALHRFRQVDVRPEAVSHPPGFDLEATLKRGRGQFGIGLDGAAPLRLAIACNRELADLVQESRLSEDQESRPATMGGSRSGRPWSILGSCAGGSCCRASRSRCWRRRPCLLRTFLLPAPRRGRLRRPRSCNAAELTGLVVIEELAGASSLPRFRPAGCSRWAAASDCG